jgi:hypothetical protein
MLQSEEENELSASKYCEECDDDDVTLASLVHRSRKSSKVKTPKICSPSRNFDELCHMAEGTRTVSSRSCTNRSVGRKRVRVVLSDDEAEESPEIVPSKKTSPSQADSMSISRNFFITTCPFILGFSDDWNLFPVLTSPFHGQQIMKQT